MRRAVLIALRFIASYQIVKSKYFQIRMNILPKYFTFILVFNRHVIKIFLKRWLYSLKQFYLPMLS